MLKLPQSLPWSQLFGWQADAQVEELACPETQDENVLTLVCEQFEKLTLITARMSLSNSIHLGMSDVSSWWKTRPHRAVIRYGYCKHLKSALDSLGDLSLMSKTDSHVRFQFV